MFGKKEFSQLNVFDFVVFLVISEIVTMSLESDKITIIHSILATTTLILLDRIESIITIRFKKLRDIFEGTPCYIILDGKIVYKNMKKQRYSVDDLSHHLRQNNIDTVSKVAYAVLETNGDLSIIKKDECSVKLPDSLICDGNINDDALTMLGKDKEWLQYQLSKKGIKDYHQVFYCVMEDKGLYVIKK